MEAGIGMGGGGVRGLGFVGGIQSKGGRKRRRRRRRGKSSGRRRWWCGPTGWQCVQGRERERERERERDVLLRMS
jgi:hypothetical protein